MISVIIASYNHANYIKQAINSILNNNYKDIELIIIDDCSTDNSVEVVQSLIKLHPKRDIKLIANQKNQGLGIVKSTGINLAKGEWTSFVDCDDYIEPDYFDTILEYQSKSNADALLVHYKTLDNDKINNDLTHYAKEIVLQDKYMMFNNMNYLGLNFLNPTLIKTELYKKIGYCQSRMTEDTPTFVSLFSIIKCLHIIPYWGYIYRQLPNSLIHSYNENEKRYYYYTNMIDSIEKVKKIDEKFSDYIKLSLKQMFIKKCLSDNLDYDHLSKISPEGGKKILEYYQINGC